MEVAGRQEACAKRRSLALLCGYKQGVLCCTVLCCTELVLVWVLLTMTACAIQCASVVQKRKTKDCVTHDYSRTTSSEAPVI